MKQEIHLSLELTPVFELDKRTNQVVVHFKEFPQAVACGSNNEEAELNLIGIFQVMLRERKEDIKEELISKYLNKDFKRLLDVEMTPA